MNHKNPMTTGHIMREIIAEMSQMNLLGQLQVVGFVLRLKLRRQRHKTLNVYLALVVLALLIYLLKG